MFHIPSRRPDLKPVRVADGAKGNWTFPDGLTPDVAVLDFLHAARHPNGVATAGFGANSKARDAWFEKWRHVQCHDEKGVDGVVNAMRHLLRKAPGNPEIKREMEHFRNNRHRMRHAEVANASHPIGSGMV